jgi:hypothetical protein
MTRYAGGFTFTGRSDAYLRETFDLWASGATDCSLGSDWAELMREGCQAIVTECHARAMNANVTPDVAREIASTVDAVAAVAFSRPTVRPVLPQEGDACYPEFWEHHNAGY